MKRVLVHNLIRTLMLGVALFGFAHITFATTVIIPTDDNMIVGSRAIVRGKVLQIESAVDPGTDRIFTYVTLRVQEVFKGQISERRIVLKQEGGEVAGRGTRVYGMPQFTRDELVIVYLDTWADGAYRVHQMFLGKFAILTDEQSGQLFAKRSMDEAVQVLHHYHEAVSASDITNQMELGAYVQMLRQKVAANRERSTAFEALHYAGVPMLARPAEYAGLSSRDKVESQWTYIHSSHPRWFEPDTGQPVVFVVNPSGAPNAQTVNDINAAMNAWSTIPGCAMRISNGGNTTACTPGENLNTIVFNNCDGRWSASAGQCQGTLALGGLSWFPGSTRVINGVTFVRATAGFVSFNPFSACNFGNSCNVQEIATHELGHAIGFGHSADNSATMAPIAHFDGRCASLRADDITGATFIYPGQGGGGGPLTITTSALPNATANSGYSQSLLASGGQTPYVWTLVSGTLPTGLVLNPTGSITGTPTTTGTSNFTVQVRDAAQATAQRALSLTVNPGSSNQPLDSVFVSQTVPTSVNPGQQFQVNIKFRNNGTQAWSGSNFYLASQNPPLNQTWGGNGVSLANFPVQPGEQLDLSFTVNAPATAGTYNFQWQVYQFLGIGFFGQLTPNVAIQVGSAPPPPPPATNNAEFVSQNVPSSLTTGQSASVSVVMRNSGTTTWTAGTYRLGSQNPQDNTTWGLNRVNLASNVAPGASATFTFNITAPTAAGAYNFQWRMNDNAAFFGATSTNVAIQVNGSGSGLVKLNGTPFGTSPPWSAGSEFDKVYDNNTSSFFDYLFADGGYAGIDLGGGNGNKVVRIRYFARSNWSGGPSRMLGGRFQGSNTSPSSGFVDLATITSTPPLGNWVEVTISDPTAYRYLRYLSPNGGYGNVAEVEFYSDSATPPPPPTGTNNALFISQNIPATLTAGQTASIQVVMQNNGTTTWSSGTYRLGSQNPQDNTTWGLSRVNLASNVAPGGTVTFNFAVTAPSSSGAYNCQWRMVQEGTGFFGGFSTNVAVQVTGGLTKLSGQAFGTSPAWAPGREFDKVYDGNTSSFFDYLSPNGGYAGIDLGSGNASRVVQVRFYARSDWAGGPSRMVGGRFQGSNTSSSSGFVDLATITSTPPLGNWVEVTISDPTAYRYLRYLSPNGGYGNVAEVEFYTGTANSNKLSGQAFGTSPAWAPGREFDKVFDGNTSTFFDNLAADGAFAGIDLGPGNATRVVRVRFYARSDWAGGPSRMLGGKFQGSNTSSVSGFVDLATITSTPPLGNWVEVTITDPTAYRYLRYLSPNGGYGNVAEVEFYRQ